MPEHFAYDISSESALGSRILTQQFNSLPMTARQNLIQCVADYGEDVHVLAGLGMAANRGPQERTVRPGG